MARNELAKEHCRQSRVLSLVRAMGASSQGSIAFSAPRVSTLVLTLAKEQEDPYDLGVAGFLLCALDRVPTSLEFDIAIWTPERRRSSTEWPTTMRVGEGAHVLHYIILDVHMENPATLPAPGTTLLLALDA